MRSVRKARLALEARHIYRYATHSTSIVADHSQLPAMFKNASLRLVVWRKEEEDTTSNSRASWTINSTATTGKISYTVPMGNLTN